jgi:hypothetical protein
MACVRFRTRSILVAPLGVLVALGAGAAVWGHDHRVPRANLHVNGQVKRLQPWSFSWVHRDGPACVSEEGDGVPSFRPIAEVHLHSTPRIVFRKEQRPRRVRAVADDRLEHGYLADARRLDVRLRKSHRDGRRVWIAKFPARVRARLFVDVEAHWRDLEGCGGDESASWDFRLRRVDSAYRSSVSAS